jgi:hypothetical protein
MLVLLKSVRPLQYTTGTKRKLAPLYLGMPSTATSTMKLPPGKAMNIMAFVKSRPELRLGMWE